MSRSAVTREVTPAPLLLEKPDEQQWDWVAKSLWAQSQKCRINLLDTVLVEGDSLSMWLFTSKSGKVMRKSEKNLNRDKVKSHFLRFSSAYERNVNNYAAVFHYKGSSKVFTADELNTAMISPLDTVLALQPYALPRGGTSGYSNFRHEYSIYGGNKDLIPVNNTFKYCESLPGEGSKVVRSKDSRVNAALQEMTVAVVKFVEAIRRVHITKLCAEFCVDSDNVPWFMCTTTCLTVKRSKITGQARRHADKDAGTVADSQMPDAFNLPANFPANRRAVSPIKEVGDGGEATFPRNLVARKSPTKGKWTNKRRGRKPPSSPVGGDDAATSGTSRRRRRRRVAASPRSVASSVNTQATPPLGATGHIPDQVLAGLLDDDAPNVIFKSGTAEETLGSTQRGGCAGDFCSVKLAPKITAAPGQGRGKGGKPSWTAEAARAQVSGTLTDVDPQEVSQVPEDTGATYKVPFRMVAQARQEAYYVALMLKRHRQGQRGEFISSEYYPEHTEKIAQTFAASFYREVQVCERCWQVYQKVEVERNRSLTRRSAAERKYLSRSARPRKQQQRLHTARSTASRTSTAGSRFGRTAPPPLAHTRAATAGDDVSPEQAALDRANAALGSLTLGDIAEVRSFAAPAPAVALVGTALMLLLTGEPLAWHEARRVMSRGDRLMDMILDLDASRIPARRLRQLLPIVRNPVFSPDSLMNVNRAAACLAGWVDGVVEYACLRHGMKPPRDDGGAASVDGRASTAPDSGSGAGYGGAHSASTPTLPPLGDSARGVSSSGYGSRAASASTLGSTMQSTSHGGYGAQLTFAQKLDRKRKQQARAARRRQRDTPSAGGDGGSTWSDDAFGGGKHGSGGGKHGSGGGKQGQGLSREAWGLSGTGGSRAMDRTGRSSKKRSASSRKAQAAARRAQEYHTKRLFEAKTVDPTGPQSFADAPAEPVIEIESRPKLLRCADGVTTVPYQVIGAPDRDPGTVNFVVVQDFFDTFESMQVLLRDFMKTTRSQFLLLNVPGQAFSEYDKSDKNLVLNNEFHAAKLEELLRNADKTMEFNTSSQGFHVVGIGNGGNIAACWGARFGTGYSQCLKSLTLVNGFAHVDKQLASILHSSANVFSCFPPTRPDLPVSYFTRFLFSEDYIKRVSMDLALSMYTAVTNPITLDGRLRLTRGALSHTDLRKLLPGVPVPLILMQCTEDVLVSPSNVDSLIEGRLARHVWSHEQDSGDGASWFGPRSINRMREVLRKPDAALVLWIKTGHEVRMESKNQFLRLLSSLADPDKALAEAEGIASGAGRAGVVAPTRIPAPPQFGVPDFRKGGDASAGGNGSDKVPLKYSRRRRAKQQSSRRRRRGKGSGGGGGDDDDGDDGGDGGDGGDGAEFRPPTPQDEDDEARRARLQEAEANYEAAMAEHKAAHRGGGGGGGSEAGATTPPRARAAAAPSAGDSKQEPDVQDSKEPPTPTRQQASSRASRPVASPLRSPAPAPAPAPAPSPPRAPTPPSPRTAARNILNQGPVGAEHVTDAGSYAGGASAASTRDRRAQEEEEMAMRLEMLRMEQEARRKQWAQEDAARAAAVASLNAQRQASRDAEADELRQELAEETRNLLVQNTRTEAGALPPGDDPAYDDVPPDHAGTKDGDDEGAAGELAAVAGEQPSQQFTDLNAMFAEMEEDDKTEAGRHKMELQQYQRVKDAMEEAKQALVDQQRAATSSELRRKQEGAIIHLQRVGRGYLGRRRFQNYKENQEEILYRDMVATQLNAVVRGFLGRRYVKRKLAQELMERQKGGAARHVQRVVRGHLGRQRVRGIRQLNAAVFLERVYRGHLGRRFAELKRQQNARAEKERLAATLVQATWRMKMQFEEYRELQILQLAAIQIQRVWRGWLGRRRALRKREWESAAPGPDRLKLGLKLIEGSKEAFERQRQEIDALHRAQERAEARVSEIYAGLKENEEELSTLERELTAVDQLDSDLRELTHDKRLLDEQVAADEQGEAASTRGGRPGSRAVARRSSVEEAAAAQRAADAYALEVAIHMKKAEREKKKLELEAEFAGVFAEIEKKKGELGKLEDNISGMEALRQRKDREFQRLQRNLTELLAEQKAELDALREKGVQLETATATSAAAAAATAAAAKEAEKRSQAMYQSTEELLKFQFMSMSLSYFSSLNMLSNLRDINADTTNRAVASSADTAAAAAAAAAAANIPSLKQMNLGAGEILDAASKRRKMEEAEKVRRVEEAKLALAKPFDEDVTKWNIHDVGRWLDTLTLGQYKRAFAEAAVDGEFLMELRAEDVADVLGVEHRLHVKKILAARDKLRPLTEDERRRKEQLEWERKAAEHRGDGALQDKHGNAHAISDEPEGPPPVATVFSMVRNNRIKRVREALNAGFDLEAADETGNTLLLVACQNVNRKVVEMCVERGANINAQNRAGNTPLHFAMAYDPEGALGEYLIDKGANDMLENKLGLSPYDGLSLDG